MRALSASELLEIWERGLAKSAPQRALLLLAGGDGPAPEEAARLSIGRRDAELLRLRACTFGEAFTGVAACERCGAQMEIECAAADFRAAPPAEIGAGATFRLSSCGHDVTFRLP